ncbi:hypothetical protein [Vagococcus lutrae]|uniref:Uncharacterized protein n=1 Tax=Vagococcus lutrae LBD1 TaxID=1408226 RepID=V6QCJ7_9ENTE|nr:hypothetical protein [Vagococcus lutrae]EST90303.1 hypothetical protein T233_00606 [Vagococcus lutrae LBD1]MDT2802026.1 hypothetical protein [Vagococcus lutrae]MDT2805849.1 hypothetical protein [Vagococcus lutrae]MDT2823828.1 hypothetical protein [Vagococcus lutrae]MDT2826216.1 hypothetical protein [Vagococcus lutrae]
MRKTKKRIMYTFIFFLMFNLPLTVFGTSYQSNSGVGFYGEYPNTYISDEDKSQSQNIVPGYPTGESQGRAIMIPKLGDNNNILLYNALSVTIIVFLYLKQQDIKKVERVNYNV